MSRGSPCSDEVASGAGLSARLGAASADLLSLYLRLLPREFFAQVREHEQLPRPNNRIYTDAVVIWLMILQRLTGHGTMETAVLELLRSLPSEFWPRPCKRLQARAEDSNMKLSSNTGSYNQARHELPLTIVEQCGDRTFLQLIQQARPATARRDAFFVDGSSMRMPHSPELCVQYPPGSNQNGESHWPLLRIVVAHDLYSGLAMRPQWGPMYGDHAVSEQVLLEQAIDRLPKGGVVLGDANFGVFSVAYAATERGHPVVLRLTRTRARYLAKEELRDGMDRRMRWKPSSHERRKHPGLPADAGVDGRLIVRQVQPSKGEAPFLLALFTTLEDEADSVIELYGQRWNIETDLRSLKAMLGLEQLRSTTPEMVAKEIDVAMVAYNLVRAVTGVAAQKAGLKPRQFSFTRVRNVIHAFAPLIAAARNERQAQQLADDMMYYVNQARLPQRRKKRPTYPRAVWSKTQNFPKRKPRPMQPSD
jgi:DDE family transposase